MALERGFFDDQGIRVEVIGDVLGGPTAIQAVAGGSAEAGLSSLPALINANAAGLPVQGVSDIQSALPSQPLEYYYVRADSDLNRVEDLAGATIAVNLWRSSFHYTAIMALENAGLDEDSADWVLLPFENQATALARGDVDVIGLMEPYNGYAQANYAEDFRLLFDAIDVFGEKQFTTHFVNREWAAQNPEAARAFVAGITQAIAWIEANQDAARAIIAEYTGIDADFVPDYRFQPDGRVVMEDVRFWINYLRGRGDIARDLTPEDVATNAYNARVADD
ncbi:MAG: ABC transporter substrate-binding protein [Anaerolineales bacterium]